MTDEDIKIEHYYKLDPNAKYWSIDLQRMVRFDDPVVVKAVARTAKICGTFEGGGYITVPKNSNKTYV